MNPSPFDSPEADLALQTEDGTSFRVSSRILSEASPFFRDLLTLPQPAEEQDVSPAVEKDVSPAVIHVAERSKVLHTLLKFVYQDPRVETLSHLLQASPHPKASVKCLRGP
ncbi:hypothetical protein JB92DRAFT_3122298 [Gautieria morchelliformis]|nr:hypothetical protein JB92DRAFT_3122298 [Gautieria morchelliformis]